MALRFLFAFYSALAVPVLVVAVGIAPNVSSLDTLWAEFLKQTVLMVTLAGALAVLALLLLQELLPPVRERALPAGIYACFAFLLPFLAVAVLLQLGLYFVFDGLVYSPVLGAIAGLLRYHENLSFLGDASISEQAKRDRLDKAYSLVVRGITVFTALYFVGLVGGAVSWIISLDAPNRTVTVYASVLTVLGYLTLGVIPGIYLRLFRQLQELKDSYTRTGQRKIIIP